MPDRFDKSLTWRWPRFAANTLTVGRGEALLDRRFDRRVPNRKDSHRYAGNDAARLAAWRRAIDAGRYRCDAFVEFAESRDAARLVQSR